MNNSIVTSLMKDCTKVTKAGKLVVTSNGKKIINQKYFELVEGFKAGLNGTITFSAGDAFALQTLFNGACVRWTKGHWKVVSISTFKRYILGQFENMTVAEVEEVKGYKVKETGKKSAKPTKADLEKQVEEMKAKLAELEAKEG